MRRLISFSTAEGDTIIVEVDEPLEPGMAPAGRLSEPINASVTFEAALDRIRPVAARVVDAVRDLAPDEVALEFGLKFDAKAGAILASSSVEANFKISVRWAPNPGP